MLSQLIGFIVGGYDAGMSVSGRNGENGFAGENAGGVDGNRYIRLGRRIIAELTIGV
jgi:hypothetical protein